MVGHISGAHAEFFHALTLQRGRLKVLPAPGPGNDWAVDSAVNFVAGIFRGRNADGDVVVVEKTATRNRSGEGWHGRNVRYRWGAGHWVKTGSRKTEYKRDRAAYAIAGWHVRGLPRF